MGRQTKPAINEKNVAYPFDSLPFWGRSLPCNSHKKRNEEWFPLVPEPQKKRAFTKVRRELYSYTQRGFLMHVK